MNQQALLTSRRRSRCNFKATFQKLIGLTVLPIILVFLQIYDVREVKAIDFNVGWNFRLGDASGAGSESFDDSSWDKVRLPHTARIEQLVTGATGPESRQWQGFCWYRKTFRIEGDTTGKVIWLKLDGAMGVADVWLNGKLLSQHLGGYLPIVLDITSEVKKSGMPNSLAIRLNNHDNPITGPKPLALLDFNYYGGLYREAQLIIKDRLHITDPILANKSASGGIFASFTKVEKHQAMMLVKTHIQNEFSDSRSASIRTVVYDANGEQVAFSESDSIHLSEHQDAALIQEIEIKDPNLWSPDSPYLYSVCSELSSKGKVYDRVTTKVGVRHISISKEGLWLNGKKTFLRGTNRHQEYPYIGYALSNNAQFRDAKKIKDAGFDFVRLSHYPHSPAFLDACDELGLMVMNCVMGWQYYSDLEQFKEFQYQQCRELIRRDRNHPSVLLWEVSLNESPMTNEFIDQINAAAHDEYPGDQCFTSGWTGAYDVLLQARQHGGCSKIKNRPCVVSEYGDWEYYANNAGLAQDEWQNLEPVARSSRQDRVDGEQRLLQQALNFQEAHNDNLKTSAFADGLWVMFDYNRGYSDDLETSGCMDIFRLAKPSYFFFKSQRSATTDSDLSRSEAFIHIANQWTKQSPLTVKVYSNCDEVALSLNGTLIAAQPPDQDRVSSNLTHPPFTFEVSSFEPGKLRAVGILDGHEVVSHEVITPGQPAKLRLSVDYCDRELEAAQNDIVFVHAYFIDDSGVHVTDESQPVAFRLEGEGELIGTNPIYARAGVATVLFRAGQIPGNVKIIASSVGVPNAVTTIKVISKTIQEELECEHIPSTITQKL